MAHDSRTPAPDALSFTDEQLRAAQHLLDYARTKAVTALVTNEHREVVAHLVFGYCGDDTDEMPTSGAVADEILRYMAEVIAPLFTYGQLPA